MNCSESIKQKSLQLGFDLVGITSANPISAGHAQKLQAWLDADYSADMAYMKRNLEKRINPAKLLENAVSVVCVGLIYKPDLDSTPPKNTLAQISEYALYNDYHDFMKQGLWALADHIKNLEPKRQTRTKVCVDSAPVAERSLAKRAGLGFIGKNRMLINPEMGLEIFLGEILTDLQLDFDTPIANSCSDCDKCINACPTGALRDNGIDARKCISYLTIEHKGDIPDDKAPTIGNTLYGCDACVTACPYHRYAPTKKNKDFEIHKNRLSLDPADIADWDQQTFDKYFANSPVTRLGLDRLKRNARICCENSKRQLH